jgi:hypothetical protein
VHGAATHRALPGFVLNGVGSEAYCCTLRRACARTAATDGADPTASVMPENAMHDGALQDYRRAGGVGVAYGRQGCYAQAADQLLMRSAGSRVLHKKNANDITKRGSTRFNKAAPCKPPTSCFCGRRARTCYIK